MYKKVAIADEEGNVIGAEPFFDAIENGSLRMVARVFVFDTEGRLLLQKRSEHVRSPHLWDHSVGGHMDEGETTYLQAAEREMEEELGLSGIPLQEIALSHRTNIFNGIFKAVVETGTEISFNEEEIEAVQWVAPDVLDARIKENPADFTNGLIETWNTFRDKLTE